MLLLIENTDVATINDVPVSKEQNVAQRLKSKLKSIPIGCTEDTEKKRKNISCRNVENSLYRLMMMMMMMDNSILSRERQTECLSMERLENDLSFVNLYREQSILMTKCVAEHLLRIWLEILSTYLEIYSLDVEVIMEAELTELNCSCIIPFESSKEKHFIQLDEYCTLTMKFGSNCKTMTSNEKQFFGKFLLCYVNLRTTTVWSTNWIMGWKIIAVVKEHSKQLTQMTINLEFSGRQRRLMTNSKHQ